MTSQHREAAMLPVAHPPTNGYRTIRGSAIHVMLALRRSSRQVVVADEELDGTDMVREFLGKRQRLTHQTGDALTQRVVETLDVIGLSIKPPILTLGNSG
jgi:hypothetical protein